MTSTYVIEALERPTDDEFVCSLYDAHVDQVRRILSRMLGPGMHVDDLTQDVFELALRKRRVLDGQGVAQGAWLAGVAIRLAYARRRQLRLRRFFGLDSAQDVPSGDDPSQPLARAEARRWVYGALDHIAEKKRTVFILYELEGLSGEQIAQLLDCPLKTVWSRLAHARREFEVALQRMKLRHGGAP
jgi:RNA polymerase sigma-70 factor (ECF subfamily)